MRIFIILILLATFSLKSEIPQNEFQQANDLFKSGQYSKAIEAYKAIIDKGNVSANLYFNLGNSYFKLNKNADAILNYERAKKLAPNDEDIDFNLRVANLRIVDKIDAAPKFFLNEWLDSFLSYFTSNGWAWLTTLALWIGAAVFIMVLYVLKGNVKRFGFIFALIFAGFGLFFWFLAQNKYSTESSSNYAIIFSESVYVKNSPDEKSTDLFILHEGTKLEVLDKVNDWYKIKLQNGNVGWIGINDITTI
jgi:tetratricopeptide (TPR) repeat protein